MTNPYNVEIFGLNAVVYASNKEEAIKYAQNVIKEHKRQFVRNEIMTLEEVVDAESLYELELPIDNKIFKAANVKIKGCSVPQKVYVIDLYSARESCCGKHYKEIMDRWLPKGEKLEELKNLLLTRYDELGAEQA